MKNEVPAPLVQVMDSESSEIYRVLFASLARRADEREIKSIAFTSSVKGEGKTTTAVHLATVAARDFGKRILLIEGDLKNPQIQRRWPHPEGKGLYHVLAQEDSFDSAVVITDQDGLEVMPAGRLGKEQRDSASVLSFGFKKIVQEASGRYDYVFVDSPPILPLVDMRIIADAVAGVVMVIRAEGPPRSLISKAVATIEREKIIGVVFNGAKSAWPGYIYGYSY